MSQPGGSSGSGTGGGGGGNAPQTRTLSGWTPGNPIDGQVIRLYKGPPGEPKALAGTYPLSNTATSQQVEISPGFVYLAELRSMREAEQSDGYLQRDDFSTTSDGSADSGAGGGNPNIPPPTGTLTISSP